MNRKSLLMAICSLSVLLFYASPSAHGLSYFSCIGYNCPVDDHNPNSAGDSNSGTTQPGGSDAVGTPTTSGSKEPATTGQGNSAGNAGGPKGEDGKSSQSSPGSESGNYSSPADGLMIDFAVDPRGLKTYGIKKDGSLWVWGTLEEGEVSDFHKAGQFEPTPYLGMKSVKSLVASSSANVTYAIFEDGTIAGKGSPSTALMLGGDNAKTSKFWVTIPGVQQVTALAVGHSHVLALNKDGTVVAWGDNSSYQLGSSTLKGSKAPVKVAGLPSIAAVAAGDDYSLALDRQGNVWEWGTLFGSEYQKPHKVDGLSDVEQIAAAGDLSLARKKDGSLWFWGANFGKTYFTDQDQMRRDEAEAEKYGDPVMYSPSNVYESEGPNFITDKPYRVTDHVRTIAGVYARDLQFAGLNEAPGTAVYITKDDGSLWNWNPVRSLTIKDGREVDDNIGYVDIPFDNPGHEPWAHRITHDGVEVTRQNDAVIRLVPIPQLKDVKKVSQSSGTAMFLLENQTLWGYAEDTSVAQSALAYDPELGGAYRNYVPANLFHTGITVTIDSKPVKLEKPPIIIDGAVMLPMRSIFTTLGAKVTYNAADQSVISEITGRKAVFKAGSLTLTVNGAKKTLKQAPIAVNGVTYVPLQAVEEALGSKAVWNENARTVSIIK